MKKFICRNITIAAALTPAALLAACSSWNSQSYASRDNRDMNRSSSYDPYGDGVAGGPGYDRAENRLAYSSDPNRSTYQRNYYSTGDNTGNVTRFDNDNPSQDNSSSQYNTGISRNQSPSDGTLNNQNVAKGSVEQLPPRTVDQNDQSWARQDRSGQYPANSAQPNPNQSNPNWNQPSQASTNDTWQSQNNGRTDLANSQQDPAYRNTMWNDSSRVAAAQAISDPSTNPTNGNAQIGATNPTRSDQPLVRRESDRMTAAGQSQQTYAANTNADSRILSLLHMKNQEEIEIGQLASSKGSDAAIRDYGDMLVRDHTSADAKVQSVASQANITLMSDAETRRLMHSEKATPQSAAKAERDAEKHADDSEMRRQVKDPMQQLRNLNGADFDRVFAEKMAKGHAKLIAEVEKAQSQVQNEQTKQLLNQLLPTLKKHERLAKELPGYTETASAR